MVSCTSLYFFSDLIIYSCIKIISMNQISCDSARVIITVVITNHLCSVVSFPGADLDF